MISSAGMPVFTRLTMSVSANTPHLAATWCSRFVVEVQARRTLRRDAGLDHALVDRGAGAGGALVVHRADRRLLTRLLVRLEDDDLRVLPAELDHRARVGLERLDGHRDRVDLLHELRAERLGERTGSRAGAEDAHRLTRHVGEGVTDAHEEFEHDLRLARVMALVVAPQDLFGGGIDHDRLHGRGADVESDDDRARHVPSPPKRTQEHDNGRDGKLERQDAGFVDPKRRPRVHSFAGKCEVVTTSTRNASRYAPFVVPTPGRKSASIRSSFRTPRLRRSADAA